MPTYEYRCTDCEHDFALNASVAEYDDGLNAQCPKCGSDKVQRRLGSVMISGGSSVSNPTGSGCCTPGGGCC